MQAQFLGSPTPFKVGNILHLFYFFMTIEQLRNYNSSCSNCGDSQHFNTYEQICYKCGHDETKNITTFFVPTASGLMEFSSQQEADKFISDFPLSVSGNPYFTNN